MFSRRLRTFSHNGSSSPRISRHGAPAVAASVSTAGEARNTGFACGSTPNAIVVPGAVTDATDPIVAVLTAFAAGGIAIAQADERIDKLLVATGLASYMFIHREQLGFNPCSHDGIGHRASDVPDLMEEIVEAFWCHHAACVDVTLV